jgi:hypothetical protein
VAVSLHQSLAAKLRPALILRVASDLTAPALPPANPVCIPNPTQSRRDIVIRGGTCQNRGESLRDDNVGAGGRQLAHNPGIRCGISDDQIHLVDGGEGTE